MWKHSLMHQEVTLARTKMHRMTEREHSTNAFSKVLSNLFGVFFVDSLHDVILLFAHTYM